MSNAKKIIREIDLFLDQSMLKTSKITQEELTRFIEEKWNEADDEKYSIYQAYIINSRMVNEYIRLRDFENMERWLHRMDLHSAADKNPAYVGNYYKGECCLECGNEEKALEYFNLCYSENEDYIFSRAPFCYEFFNKHLKNPRDLSDREEENHDEYIDLGLELKHWQTFFRTEDVYFHYEIFDEEDEYTEEPTAEQENGLIYLRENQENVLENILLELLKQYPGLQKNYGYSEEARVDCMPDVKSVQGFADLLSPTYFYITSVIKDEYPYIGYGFSCSWDSEHGLGIMTHKDSVIEIGGADIAFDSWVAEEDLQKK
ncbi:DUF6985 domain-containing protein [Chryseobacterium phosphatilyticum]|uniref:DUF6985 domain-containing protein n=1 Tax=Chryseobacterium phosphatilyticum TaxID=475075 RepID=UPI001E36E34E|nr:hypothetical protein [Chryseobacterium phosphatilyticum]